jgi:hypothetical protein
MKKPKECYHNLDKVEQHNSHGKIEIHYKCNKCGHTQVEVYRFVEGYEKDKKGKIVGKFY